jgi:hypothetical protein
VETGALFTVPVDTLRLLLPWVAAGVDSLRRSVAAGLASLLVCTEVFDLRLSPLCPGAWLPTADLLLLAADCSLPTDLLPVAAELLLSLPTADGWLPDDLPRVPWLLV